MTRTFRLFLLVYAILFAALAVAAGIVHSPSTV